MGSPRRSWSSRTPGRRPSHCSSSGSTRRSGRRSGGWVSSGLKAYAYAFVFFTGTVSFALAEHVPNWDTLVHRMDPWVTVHGALMVLAGLAFGWSVVQARVFPRWTGVALMAGVVQVAASSGLPEAVQTAPAGVRDAALVGMGASLWLARRERRRVRGEGGSR